MTFVLVRIIIKHRCNNRIKSSELSYLSHPVEFVRNLLATSGGAEWTFMVCSSEVRGRRHYISRHFTLTQ